MSNKTCDLRLESYFQSGPPGLVDVPVVTQEVQCRVWAVVFKSDHWDSVISTPVDELPPLTHKGLGLQGYSACSAMMSL